MSETTIAFIALMVALVCIGAMSIGAIIYLDHKQKTTALDALKEIKHIQKELKP